MTEWAKLTMDNMKIGICLDPWKLTIFKKHLDKNGYEYEVFEGKDMTTIKVEVEPGSLLNLQYHIKEMNDTARRSKKH